MKRYIEYLQDINHSSLDKIKNHLQNLSVDFDELPSINNLTIYKNTNTDRLKKDIVCNLKNLSYLSPIIPTDIVDEIYVFLDYLKSIFDLEIVWLMIYKPKSMLNFHFDIDSNRHLVAFTEDEKFYNYESSSLDDCITLYNNKIEEFKNNIEEFNNFFIQDNSKSNKITNLKTNKIYVFNNSLHTFYNASNKIRVNFVFEVKNCKII